MNYRIKTCQYVLFTLVTVGILFTKHSVLSQETEPECSRRLYAKNGTGVVASYNYPFQYWTDMDCEYTIWLPDNNNEICFTFHRFNMKGNETKDGASQVTLGDYLEFEANGKRHRYHQNGKVYDTSGVQDNWLTVWDHNFCWPVTSQEFILRMVSDTTGVGTGFYATYELKAASANRTSSANLPCTDSQWTCFDGGCVDLEQVCDGEMTCTDGSDETYFHAHCDTGSVLACDFNSDCGFTGISSSDGWVIESESDYPDRGPSADHTRGNIRAGGSYARTDFYTGRTSHLMMYDDTSLPVHQDSCLSFWFLMGDIYPGKLEVFYEQPSRLSSYPDVLDDIRPIWVRDGNFGERWHHAEIFVSKETVTTSKRIIFMATRSSDLMLQIAVDDISLIPGKCFGDDIGCNFEDGMCDWSIRKGSEDNVETWERVRRTGSALGPDEDASRSTTGYYLILYLADSSSHFRAKDQLVTEPIIINGRDTYELCLTMAYFSTGAYDSENRPRTITITVETLDGQTGDKYIVELVDSSQSYFLNRWERKGVTMTDIKEPFRISFRPEFFTYPVVLALDEIAVLQGSCDDIALDSCGPGRFRCSYGNCVQHFGNCDGYSYCSDSSDRTPEACQTKCIERCGLGMFCCNLGPCINSSKHCDGFNDCGDWYDENNCRTGEACQAPMFWCPHYHEYYYYPDRCIDESYLCDGTEDCEEGDDETDCDKINGLSAGTIAGIVIGVVVGIIVIGAIIGCVYAHYREEKKKSETTTSNTRTAAYQETSSGLRVNRSAGRSEGQSEGRNDRRGENRRNRRNGGRREGHDEGDSDERSSEGRSEGRSRGHREGHDEGDNDGRSEGRNEGRRRSRRQGRREGHNEASRTDPSAPEEDPENQTPPSYFKAMDRPDLYRRPETPKSKGAMNAMNQSPSSHITRVQPHADPVVLPPSYDHIESGEYNVTTSTSRNELSRIQMDVMRRPREAVDSGHPIPREAPPPYTPTAGAAYVVEEARYSAETSSVGDQSRPQGKRGRKKRRKNKQTTPTAPTEDTNLSDGATNDAFEPERYYSLSDRTDRWASSEYSV